MSVHLQRVMHIYIHVYIYMCIYIYIHVYICVFTYIYMYTYMCVYIYSMCCTCPGEMAPVNLRACERTCAFARL